MSSFPTRLDQKSYFYSRFPKSRNIAPAPTPARRPRTEC
ncbi:hypothetical protein BSLA_01f4735 [Burkholderia stabilis]|nr:hypothetical protein BSLA_01f4735 [Burkholderia stabilis]